jgi:hypothetical protein
MSLWRRFEGCGFTAYKVRIMRRMMSGVSQVF